MTPDTDSPDAPDLVARPSLRAILLGAVGVLFAGAAVAVAGLLAGGADLSSITTPQASTTVDTQHGQLGTFPLHDEKPMKGIGKGVGASGAPSATPSPTPSPTP